MFQTQSVFQSNPELAASPELTLPTRCSTSAVANSPFPGTHVKGKPCLSHPARTLPRDLIINTSKSLTTPLKPASSLNSLVHSSPLQPALSTATGRTLLLHVTRRYFTIQNPRLISNCTETPYNRSTRSSPITVSPASPPTTLLAFLPQPC